MIAIGLIATVAAALLSTNKAVGSAAELSWEAKAPVPDSRTVMIPGGGRMQIREAGIRDTELNAGGFRIYRVAAILRIAAGSATGQGRLRCATRVPGRTLVAHTPNSRAAYPRSSSGEDLLKQELPENSLVEFNSHGTDLALVPLGDAFDRFTTVPGVVVDWIPFRKAIQEWQWGLPEGRPKVPLELGFASFWRTAATPAAHISCTLETAAGSATAATAGALGG